MNIRVEPYLKALRDLTPQLEVLVEKVERDREYPWEAYELLRSAGMLKLTLPQEWGGEGMTLGEFFPILQEVARLQGTLRLFVHGQNGIWRLVDQFGTADQKARWLPVHRDGGIFAFALTESGNGTGRDLSTVAQRDGDDWILNGRKHLITNAAEAEMVHVIVRTGDEPGRETTCFLLPKGTDGFSVEKLPPTMGGRGGSHDTMVLENVRLPGSAVLGEVGGGLDVGLRGFLDVSRLSIAAGCVGLAREAYELAVRYSRERITFGKPISSRQAIRLTIAEMAAEIYAAQAAVDKAAAKFDAGQSIAMEAAICKYLCVEMLGRVTDAALRMHGGIGYTEAHAIERHYRDARALWFEEGTSEIQRMVIADQVLNHSDLV